MLLNCLHGLCAFPNMVIDVNIARKSGKEREKELPSCRQLLTTLGLCLHGLCTFPNMVINADIATKAGKKRKKNKHNC